MSDPGRKAPRPERSHATMSRLFLSIIREAGEPVTVRQITERIAANYCLGAGDKVGADKIIHNVRNAISRRNGQGLVRKERDGVVFWWVG